MAENRGGERFDLGRKAAVELPEARMIQGKGGDEGARYS